jgi:hypothetical protein
MKMIDPLLATDAIRYAHIFSVAVGIGASFQADYAVLTRLNERVGAQLLEMLHLYHRIVWGALFGMWITGLALIWVRTGFDLANFTPKLFSKLAIVTLLTINAIMIGQVAMPLLGRNLDRPLMAVPLGPKIAVAIVAGVSTTSWLLALAMGVSKVLAASGWTIFLELVPLSYASSLAVSLGLILLLHRRGEAA